MSKTNDWLYVVMEEYKAIRQEGYVALQAQQSTLAFGIAALGAIIYWAVSQIGSQPELSGIMFAVAATVSNLIIIIWIGEVVRMARTVGRLCDIERAVNKSLIAKNEPLVWIRWIVTEDAKFPWSFFQYIAGFCVFFAITALSLYIGIRQLIGEWSCWAVAFLLAFMLGSCGVTIYHVIARYLWVIKLYKESKT